MRRRLMVYGTYPEEEKDRAERLLADFVKAALEDGWSFVTRNGAADGNLRLWPEAQEGMVPADDLVIRTVGEYCERSGTTRRSLWRLLVKRSPTPALRKRLRTYVSPGRTVPRNIGQEMPRAPDTKFHRYSTFLAEAKMFVFIGGGHGVSRMILTCHSRGRRFLAVTSFGGSASEFGEPIYSVQQGEYYQNFSYDDCLRLRDPNITGQELYQLLLRALSRRRSFLIRLFELVRAYHRFVQASAGLVLRVEHPFWILVIHFALLGLSILVLGLVLLGFSHVFNFLVGLTNSLLE